MAIGYVSIDSIALSGQRHGGVPGGGALYGALGARAAGASVKMAACCGEDFAPVWLERLAALGIDLSAVAHGSGPTRRARLAHAEDGERASPHHAEALWHERTRALAPPLPERIDADALMLAPMALSRIALFLDRASAPVVADTSEAFADGGLEAWRAILPRLAIFAPSREETRQLFPALSDDDATRALAALGCDIVHKRGAEGLAFCSAGSSRVERQQAAAVEVVDPTGAGDATVGALAAGLAHGLPLADNARQAAQIGSRAVTGVGPSALGLAFAS